MGALLSFEQAPPFAAPLRFFLTAPLFAILAGLLLLWSGPALWASRWTPSALALTHLISVGFMLQVMLGALLQILPVVAGANIARPLLVARAVHLATTLGCLLLSAGFLSYQPLLFRLAGLFLGSGAALFVGAAAHALCGVPASSPTPRALKLALIGLGITVGVGVLLTLTLDGTLALPLQELAAIHIGWGFLGWGVILLAGVGFVVVPMFQMTPAYPAWFTRAFSGALFTLLGLWSVAAAAGWPEPVLAGVAVLAVSAAGLFAALTLRLQSLSKRARFDATQRSWALAMLCALAACALWLLAAALPELADRPQWWLSCGVLILVGGFMSVIIGMLYKIVPFLVWLHLQNLGGRRLLAPNMNKVIARPQIDRQLLAHAASLALLLAAALWPPWFTYPAGVALVLANAWLLSNLLAGVALYRRHCLKIAALPSAAASG